MNYPDNKHLATLGHSIDLPGTGSMPVSNGGGPGAGGALAIAAAMTASISADVGGRDDERDLGRGGGGGGIAGVGVREGCDHIQARLALSMVEWCGSSVTSGKGEMACV
jgi:hypothetical protein